MMNTEEAIERLKTGVRIGLEPKGQEAVDTVVKELETLRKHNKALQNRCWAVSRGELCGFCKMECENRA